VVAAAVRDDAGKVRHSARRDGEAARLGLRAGAACHEAFGRVRGRWPWRFRDATKEPALMEIPRYDDLPAAPAGGRSAWGLFGEHDNVGLINLLTPRRIAEAARLIRKGSVFPLDAPVDAFSPAIAASRGIPRHRVLHRPGSIGFDDVLDNFYPQGSSQWDSLGHVGYGPNAFYNGATEDDIASGRRNGIEHWARHGIVGRLVILDMIRTLDDADRPYRPGDRAAFTVEDLELARERSRVTYRPGDILLVHTGFAAWYLSQAVEVRYEVQQNVQAPGVAQGEAMCRYLWDTHVAAIVSDSFAVEAFPPEGGEDGFMHRMLIGQFGMALGELWWTDDLARDCANDGVYEAFLVSAPIHMPGGIGSPANALAIK
jgi:kynurenine formamidase